MNEAIKKFKKWIKCDLVLVWLHGGVHQTWVYAWQKHF